MTNSRIIAVGDELLAGHTQDTNSSWLATQFRQAGYPVIHIEVVPDQAGAIIPAIHRAIEDGVTSRIAVCGGIGPTTDDRTMEAVAQALGVSLEENPTATKWVQATVDRLHQAGRLPTATISPANHKMTLIPAGAKVEYNAVGMAPCIAYPLATDRWLFVLPGVPRELKTIVEQQLLPQYFTNGTNIHYQELIYQNIAEATLYGPMQILEKEFPNLAVGSYPNPEIRQIILRISGENLVQVETAITRMQELAAQEPH